MGQKAEAYKWLSLAPVGMLVAGCKWASDVLLPNDTRSSILAEWEGFYMVRIRVMAGMLYLFVAAAVAVVTWLSGCDVSRADISAAYFAAIGVSVISAASLWNASIQIRIRLRRLRQVG